jgi:hypothetical protein
VVWKTSEKQESNMDGLTTTILVAIGFCAVFAILGKIGEGKTAKSRITPAE